MTFDEDGDVVWAEDRAVLTHPDARAIAPIEPMFVVSSLAVELAPFIGANDPNAKGES
jgi:hypothetical protein